MMITKKHIIIATSLLIMAVIAIVTAYAFLSVRIVKIDEGVVGDITTQDGTTRYLAKTDSGFDVRAISGGKTTTLFSISSGVDVLDTSWSKDYQYLAATLSVPLETAPQEGEININLAFSVYKDGAVVYTSKQIPDDYMFADATTLVLYYSNDEDWTKPGYFAKMNPSADKEPKKLLDYESVGVNFLGGKVDEFLFLESGADEENPAGVISSLNISTKKVSSYTSVPGAVAIKLSSAGEALISQLQDGKLSISLGSLKDGKTKALVGEGGYIGRFASYKNTILGFSSENYIYGEQSEGDTEGVIKRDIFAPYNKPKVDILRGYNLTGCYSPQIISRFNATFVCGNTLYSATGLLF